jgi:hypothetical protein
MWPSFQVKDHVHSSGNNRSRDNLITLSLLYFQTLWYENNNGNNIIIFFFQNTKLLLFFWKALT